jgi:hypothetical protein
MDGGGELERECSFTVVKQTKEKMNNWNKKEKISENLSGGVAVRIPA